ncbi:MAG: hypothetical protein LBE53_07190 [Paucimonas sp.]|uniref:hypothetical protein n=1 Tax=Pantoea sp. Cy-639 TaxID=2608360 RepID=UPI00141ED241|nr:hypothetical protein [Pantoea sp. Cy-639]MDR2306963.1 hypothetical protein [Paucimonas sp.]NIF18788.1 hypothetical protein [Pantoea sp. Cy-639]
MQPEEGDFASQVWQWFGEERYRLILGLGALYPALDYLALDADTQVNSTPMCPACEAWYGRIVPVHDALEAWGGELPARVREALAAVWRHAQGLSEEALRCGDWPIFREPDWVALREAAAEALRVLGWEALEEHLEALLQDCREADERRRRTGLFID